MSDAQIEAIEANACPTCVAFSSDQVAPIAIGFWCLNGGLLLMALVSLLPLGLAQAWASITEGLWYARSSDFLYTPALTVLRWLRTPGDIVFSIGALSIGVFMVGLLTGWSLKKNGETVEAGSPLTQSDAEELANR